MSYYSNEKIEAIMAEDDSFPLDRRSIKSYIKEWEDLIQDLDGKIMFEEYVNYLDKRDCLKKILDILDGEDKKILIEELNPVDKIFIEKTVESEENVWGSINEKRHNWNRKDNWYYYRLPKQGFLKDEDII